MKEENIIPPDWATESHIDYSNGEEFLKINKLIIQHE